MFSSISPRAWTGSGRPASWSAAKAATHASARAATPSACDISVWPSQIRTSTVPKLWCGRTLHQICVLSTIDPVRSSSSTKRAYSSQSANASGRPQRGKLLVKTCVRVECRRVSRPP